MKTSSRKRRRSYFRTDIDLNDAFKALRKVGYYATQLNVDYKPENKQGQKHVMFHPSAYKDKINGESFFLDFDGDGHEICRILNEHNIKTEWNGDYANCIKVIQ